MNCVTVVQAAIRKDLEHRLGVARDSINTAVDRAQYAAMPLPGVCEAVLDCAGLAFELHSSSYCALLIILRQTIRPGCQDC